MLKLLVITNKCWKRCIFKVKSVDGKQNFQLRYLDYDEYINFPVIEPKDGTRLTFNTFAFSNNDYVILYFNTCLMWRHAGGKQIWKLFSPNPWTLQKYEKVFVRLTKLQFWCSLTTPFYSSYFLLLPFFMTIYLDKFVYWI